MSRTPSPLEYLSISDAHDWVSYLPEGAISLGIEGSSVVLRASSALQNRFETLLDKQKLATFDAGHTRV